MSNIYVRVPPSLALQIKRAAQEAGISVNLWMQRLAENALAAEKMPPPPDNAMDRAAQFEELLAAKRRVIRNVRPVEMKEPTPQEAMEAAVKALAKIQAGMWSDAERLDSILSRLEDKFPDESERSA